jgi:hypothetical protein
VPGPLAAYQRTGEYPSSFFTIRKETTSSFFDSGVKVKINSHHVGENTRAKYDVRALINDTASLEAEGVLMVPQTGRGAHARYEQLDQYEQFLLQGKPEPIAFALARKTGTREAGAAQSRIS